MKANHWRIGDSCLIAVAVLLPSHPLSAQRLIDLTRRPETVIHKSFTSIAGVRALPGSLAGVTDHLEHLLLLATFADGTHTPIGRQGEGPSEYRFPSAPLAGPSNTTYVVAASLQRALVVSPTGAIVSTMRLPRPRLPPGTHARGSDRSGRLYCEGNSLDPERGTFSDVVDVLRWNPRDNRIDTVSRVWSGGRVIVNRPTGRASLARSITPFPALDAWAVYPDGAIAIVRHQPFRVDVVNTDGTVRRGSPLTYKALPVTTTDRTMYRERMSFVRSSAMLKGGGSGPQLGYRGL